jgi:hypothetical protein
LSESEEKLNGEEEEEEEDAEGEGEGGDDDDDKMMSANLEGVGDQISTYARQLKGYLENLDAKIDSYRFSIQKEDNGMTIELNLKTTIKPKRKSPELE